MAILSNSELLLNHIHNSFIFGDDTGLCELIIDKDFSSNFNIKDALEKQLSYPITDVGTDSFKNSPDISLCINTVSVRKLSSEARIKEVELNDSKMVVSHQIIDTGEWPRILSDNDINELFSYSEPCKPSKVCKSMLSKMLEETNKEDIATVNIFSQYAKFSASRYLKSKKSDLDEIMLNPIPEYESPLDKSLRNFNIYFWDFPEQRNRSNPVVVRPIVETRVMDLIGLACWKYVEENRFPALSSSTMVSKFQLYMFEDDEDLEFGFGSLNNIDPIYKYQFSNLALLEYQRNGRNKIVSICSTISNNSFVTRSYMEKMGLPSKSIIEIDSVSNPRSVSNSSDILEDSIFVEIQLAHGVSKFRFSPDTTVEQIISHTINKRQLVQHGDVYRYKLELASEPHKELDMALTLRQLETFSFVLVRDLSRRKPAIPDLINEDSSSILSKLVDVMQPQTYMVYLKQPLKRWESVLSISQETIEIECNPVKLPFRIKPKSIRFPVSFLANCDIIYHGQNDEDVSSKITIKFLHLKKKSAMARNLRVSISQNGIESDSISSRSTSRNDLNSVMAQDLSTNNSSCLLSELTTHCISCEWSTGKIIYNQVLSIMNFKKHFIRQEYLNLLK